jgi:hypothetical protein
MKFDKKVMRGACVDEVDKKCYRNGSTFAFDKVIKTNSASTNKLSP